MAQAEIPQKLSCELYASYVATLELNALVHGVQSIVHSIVLITMDDRL